MPSDTTRDALAIVQREEEYHAHDANVAAEDFTQNEELPGENEAAEETEQHQQTADNIGEALQ